MDSLSPYEKISPTKKAGQGDPNSPQPALFLISTQLHTLFLCRQANLLAICHRHKLSLFLPMQNISQYQIHLLAQTQL